MTRPIAEIAARLGIDDDLIPYGRDKAKIHLRALEARQSARNGKLVVVRIDVDAEGRITGLI